jgi:hypothetical protein
MKTSSWEPVSGQSAKCRTFRMLTTKQRHSMQSERTKGLNKTHSQTKCGTGIPSWSSLFACLVVPIKLESLQVLDTTTIMQCNR